MTNDRWQSQMLTAMAAIYLKQETFFKNQYCHFFFQFHFSAKSKVGISCKEILKEKKIHVTHLDSPGVFLLDATINMGTKKKAFSTVPLPCLSPASGRCAHLVDGGEGERMMVYAPWLGSILTLICRGSLPLHILSGEMLASQKGKVDHRQASRLLLVLGTLLSFREITSGLLIFSAFISVPAGYVCMTLKRMFIFLCCCHLQEKINIFTFWLPEDCYQTQSRWLEESS